MSHLNLPHAIAAYFDADRGDAHAVARCFASDAVVKDEGRTYCGREAIEAWKAAASAKYAYTSVPLALERTNGRHIVTARLTGNFPGSPVDLHFAFRLEGEAIAALEITP
jgi:hypothetical protein